MRRYFGSAGDGRGRRPGAGLSAIGLAFACVIAGSCDPLGPGDGPLRFGQSGAIRVTVEVPLYLGAGVLQQVLTWRSDGAWKVFEEISYREMVGEETLAPSPGLPFEYASMYASIIQKLNDDEGAKLLGVPELDEIIDPLCTGGRSRVTVRIDDQISGEIKEWTRCARGNLSNLTTQDSGPDVVASRVIQAAIFVRNSTVGPDFISTYSGSLPFGTIERSTRTGSGLGQPTYFRSVDGGACGDAPAAWIGFWGDHVEGREIPPPEVDWCAEMVLVAAIGERHEVGDSVEVRRVLAIGEGTRFEVAERGPGDFCAPARRTTTPIHIVLAPKSPEPITSTVLAAERVPCGT